jgi:DNA polymerase-3 subunit chi
MHAVDFYVVTDPASDAYLRHACRVAEQAVDEGKKVFVRAAAHQAVRIDDLLWTFGDRSFLPHELATAESPSHPRIRVLIGSEPPVHFRDTIVNVSDTPITDLQAVERVAEFVPADPELKAAARERFKYYRGLGVEPTTHNV